MVRGSPSMCMRQIGQPRSATRPAIAGSPRRAVTSLTSVAPASRAARATAALVVSIDSSAGVAAARRSMTGTTRASSSSTDTGSEPGRVDSPPMSRIAAPSSASSRPWATAESASACRPPSENESGVTLTIPMTQGKVERQVGGRVVAHGDEAGRPV